MTILWTWLFYEHRYQHDLIWIVYECNDGTTYLSLTHDTALHGAWSLSLWGAIELNPTAFDLKTCIGFLSGFRCVDAPSFTSMVEDRAVISVPSVAIWTWEVSWKFQWPSCKENCWCMSESSWSRRHQETFSHCFGPWIFLCCGWCDTLVALQVPATLLDLINECYVT